jgi:hypothetical protein
MTLILTLLMVVSAQVDDQSIHGVAAVSPKVSVELVSPKEKVYAGVPLNVLAVVSNENLFPVFILDWEGEPDVLGVKGVAVGFDGISRDYAGLTTLWVTNITTKGDFKALPPGRTEVRRQVTPMFPGTLTVEGQLCCPYDTYKDEKGRHKMPGAWKGIESGLLRVEVEDSPPPDMAKRFEQIENRLLAPSTSVREQNDILATVAVEKHYFAARFIRNAYEKLSPGPAKEMALARLVELAAYGTAYEFLPLLLDKLGDANSDSSNRKAIAEYVGQIIMDDGRQILADGQALYQVPEALLKRSEDTMRTLEGDKDPFVAAKAREVIGKVDKNRSKKEGTVAPTPTATAPAPTSTGAK